MCQGTGKLGKKTVPKATPEYHHSSFHSLHKVGRNGIKRFKYSKKKFTSYYWFRIPMPNQLT